MPDPEREGPEQSDEPELPLGPSPNDPRLQIPEVLRGSGPPSAPKLTPKPISEATQMGRAWGTAMDFVFTILAGALLGWLFDRWRGTTPTGALIGLSLGFVLAFYRIVRATQAQERAEQAAKNKDRAR